MKKLEIVIRPENLEELEMLLEEEKVFRRKRLWGAFAFLFFKTSWVKQEVVDVYGQNTVFIIVRLHNVFGDDYLLERIINLPEWLDFLRPFCFIGQGICRLDIISGSAKIANEINFQLLADYLAILISLSNRNNSYIDIVTTHTELIVNYILHGMGLFELTEVNPGIAKPKIGKVILSRSFDIFLSSYIVSLS